MKRFHLLSKHVFLVSCAMVQLVLTYYFMFLERQYPVSTLGSRSEPLAAMRDTTSRLSIQVVNGGAASWAAVPFDTVVDLERLENGIRSAGSFLCRQCDERGQFVYKVNLVPDIKDKPRYNVLRHAGTIYALAQLYNWCPSEPVLATLERGAQFLKTNCIRPVPEKPELLAVWSSPELTGANHPLKAKLGGAGLTLVALASLEQIRPGSNSLDDLTGLGRFILYMQRSDGSFYSKYIPSAGGRSDKWTSLYYPGEAALGLVMLYELDPDPKWLQAAARSIDYLARLREGKSTVEADHWALLATTRLLPLLNRCPTDLREQAALVHARQICASMMADQLRSSRASNAYGGFASDGRTCPSATRLEGLLAALTFLNDDDRVFRNRMEESVRLGMSFVLRSQVSSGEHAGAVPRAISQLSKRHPQYSDAFNRRATEIRIDYVQHALSAMIQYHVQYHRQSGLMMENAKPAEGQLDGND